MTFRYTTLVLALALTACGGDKNNDTDDTDTSGGGTDTDPNDTSGGTDTDDSGTPALDPCTEYTGNITCAGTVATLTGTFTKDIRLTKGYTWVLSGKVQIGEDGTEDAEPTNNAVLTIDPGVTVYGTNQSFLAINRGSQIFANGTAQEPVVFTSQKKALGEDAAAGDWGGLVLNGRAPVNAAATAGGAIAGEAGTGLFGGNTPNDNSGKLSYVRVEFGGFPVLPDEELNGITFAGVGSGTQVDHIQVHFNADDGIEFFGGTVDVKYAVLSCIADDSLDTDFGYVGRIQHLVAVACSEAGETGDPSGTENDNLKDNNAATPVSKPVVSNATFIGRAAKSSNMFGVVLRRGTAMEIHNSIVTNYPTACLSVRDEATAPAIKNSIFSCSTDFDPGNGGTDAEEDVFNATGANNSTASPDLESTTLTLGSAPNFKPKSGSPALSGAVQPTGGFFDNVTHKGAFGADDWMTGWTSFPAK